MRPPPIPLHEKARLDATREYAPATSFDDAPYASVLELARDLFDVPTTFVSLLEHDCQIIPVRRGLGLCETAREISFCAHAVAREEMLVVPDATLDPRFADNPLVTGAPHIRFYAGTPLVSPSGHPVGTLCLADTRPRVGLCEEQRHQLRQLSVLVLDQLEVRRLEQAHAAGRSRFEGAAAISPDSIVCVGEGGRITSWNASAERMLGYSAAEALGRPIDLIVPERMRDGRGGLGYAVAEALPALAGSTAALGARCRDGTELPVELSLWRWQDGGAPGFAIILREVTARLAFEERLLRLAHHDPITGLPNRAVLRRRVERLGTGSAALLLLDLDGFKDINDDLGRAAGDAVLKQVASRMVDGVRATDTVARLDGGGFAVLLPGAATYEAATEVAQALISAAARPVEVDGRQVSVDVSVGIALYPGDGADAASLTANADLALRQAKAEGRLRARAFTPALRRAADRARVYDNDLRRALDRNEFEVFYQPQVRVADEMLVGAEALLRWRHPVDGLLAPGAFLTALDHSPLSADVGRWVLRSACAQAAAWRAAGAAGFQIGVNLFGSQFGTGDLVADVRGALGAAGLPAYALELEITETTILRRDQRMLAPLQTLRGDGVGVAFDDYGTGYGSLTMLRRFPVTRLKIDKAFVQGMCTDPADAAIVRSVLFLGGVMGMAVIAEGVETRQQFERLRNKGCTEVQGYLFGRPMPATEFTKLVKASRVRAA